MTMDDVLKYTGSTMVYHPKSGEPVEFVGVMHPINYRGRQSVGQGYTPVGRVDESRYVLYATADMSFSSDGVSWVEFGGRGYVICKWDIIYFSDKGHHCCVILKPIKEDKC